MIDTKLLADICEIPGAPGFEQRIREKIISEVKPFADELTTDAMGNIIAIKKGSEDKKVLVAAHMDEISFIVTHIDDEGFVRFHPLGGFDPKTLTAQRVIIHGKQDIMGVMGTKPIHVMTPEERKKMPEISDFFIDTGRAKDEVSKLIAVGDPITRERKLIDLGDCVNSKSIDNRVSVYILIEALKQLKNTKVPYDIYGVFTVQEEVGLRGAMTAASGVDPDFGIVLDVTMAYDLPNALPHERVTQIGKGAAIKVLDGSTICDYRMVRFMTELAEKNEISYQKEILPAGGTDGAAIQRYSKGGAITGGVSIPCRYLHQVIETAHKEDISACINLLKLCLKNLDNYDWTFK